MAALSLEMGYPANNLAGPPATITFEDTGDLKPVIFDHKGHLKEGLECKNCHSSVFKMKVGSSDKGNAMTMKSMKAGQFCGACHDGKKTFSVNTSCKKCHNG